MLPSLVWKTIWSAPRRMKTIPNRERILIPSRTSVPRLPLNTYTLCEIQDHEESSSQEELKESQMSEYSADFEFGQNQDHCEPSGMMNGIYIR